MRGVVDSEDLPLSISRERPQDSRLLARIKEVLTRKVLRHLQDIATTQPAIYKEFYLEFNFFLKEGICQDFKSQEALSKLLLFESSIHDVGQLVSLDDYISRLPPEQKDIYYLVAPSRHAALKSPYYETFKKHGKEVLLLYNAIDEFVMANLKTYADRPLISAEKSNVDLGTVAETEEKLEEKKPTLGDIEVAEVCSWLMVALGTERVKEVKATSRLSDSPAIVTDHESASLRRMMRALVREYIVIIDVHIYCMSIYRIYIYIYILYVCIHVCLCM